MDGHAAKQATTDIDDVIPLPAVWIGPRKILTPKNIQRYPIGPCVLCGVAMELWDQYHLCSDCRWVWILAIAWDWMRRRRP